MSTPPIGVFWKLVKSITLSRVVYFSNERRTELQHRCKTLSTIWMRAEKNCEKSYFSRKWNDHRITSLFFIASIFALTQPLTSLFSHHPHSLKLTLDFLHLFIEQLGFSYHSICYKVICLCQKTVEFLLFPTSKSVFPFKSIFFFVPFYLFFVLGAFFSSVFFYATVIWEFDRFIQHAVCVWLGFVNANTLSVIFYSVFIENL